MYISPPKESDTLKGKIWKLKKTLYGLIDAARQFYDSIEEVLLKLGMTQSQVHPILYYLKEQDRVIQYRHFSCKKFIRIRTNFVLKFVHEIREKFVHEFVREFAHEFVHESMPEDYVFKEKIWGKYRYH